MPQCQPGLNFYHKFCPNVEPIPRGKQCKESNQFVLDSISGVARFWEIPVHTFIGGPQVKQKIGVCQNDIGHATEL